ncbi:hypothetical protein EDD27_2947 [Nonomuraea polychroma]|uniref:SMP-30/gluconolaconase/LRE-like protein n=1 Tax=Nonomuraea polychroma TaxID=46176 RepID=A0A438M3U5_9ACTN|nr:hypothetical protein [Nonomuraea polychroma]RVX40536.1 hypothetical protein EDD27_2947 [Nonomuraea polychroma]
MDLSVTKIDLPRPVRAAASDGTTVWCAGTDGVHAYTTSGTPLPRPEAGGDNGARTPELRSLAAVPGTVPGTAGVPGTLPETVMVPRTFAGTASPEGSLQGTLAGTAAGRVYWLDPDGTPHASARFDGRVLAGGGEIWAVAGGQARRLTGPGRLAEPVELTGLDSCAVEGERLWWTSTRDTLLRGGPREIDLGPRERGGMAVCAGSLWISVRGGLLRVSAWSGEPRRLVEAPDGPVPFLVCANGVLAGGGRDLFALAPAGGAALRVIKLGLRAPVALVIAAGKHIWAFPAGRAQALIVPAALLSGGAPGR